MKNTFILIFVILLLIALTGCDTDIGDETMKDHETQNTGDISTTYVYNEGIYPDKNWSEFTADDAQTTSSPGANADIDKDAAIALALEEFKEIKQSGICQSYVLKGVFYDTEDNIWIVYFGEDTEMPGSCYNIAISKANGEVVSMWPSE